MAHAGLILDNPVSGERFEFRRTAADTNGELLEFDLDAGRRRPRPRCSRAPRAGGALRRRHSGRIKFRLGPRKIVAGPGDVVVVPAGKVHAFKNVGGEEAKVRVQVTPALDMERLFETTVALAEEGATNRKGMPKPLHLALFVRRSAARSARRSRPRRSSPRCSPRSPGSRPQRGHGARYGETVAAEPAIVAVTA